MCHVLNGYCAERKPCKYLTLLLKFKPQILESIQMYSLPVGILWPLFEYTLQPPTWPQRLFTHTYNFEMNI